jgi:hypothetical protein
MKHGHAQIQYKDGAVESLVGFDPVKDRQFLHDMLDEFLNEHVIPAVRGEIPGGTLKEDEPLSFTSNHFIVYGHVD